MQTFGELIRSLRKEKGYPLRKVAAFLDIDQAILSKVERGIRNLGREQVVKLAEFFNYSEKELLITYYSDKVLSEIEDVEYAKEILGVAEEKMDYLTKSKISYSEIIDRINAYFAGIKSVQKVWLFGSFAREEHDYKSDIDIMVEVDPTSKFTLFDLAEFQYQLQNRMPYKIDVVMKGGLRPEVLDRVKPDLKLIYEK